jgi:hypothetical protein
MGLIICDSRFCVDPEFRPLLRRRYRKGWALQASLAQALIA